MNHSCPRCRSMITTKKGLSYNTSKKICWQRYKCQRCGKTFKAHRVIVEEEFKYQSKPIPKQNWVALTQAQNNEKLMLMDLVKELLDQIEFKHSKKVGRNNLDMKDIIFCLTLKIYSGLSSRRLKSDLQIAKEHDYINHVPHFTTLMGYLGDERLTPVFHELIKLAALPLKQIEHSYAVDSSGFSTSKFGRWFDYKWDEEKEKRIYRKAHIMVGTTTNIITSIQTTNQYVADSPQLIPLLNKSKLDFTIKEVSADRAYLGSKNLEAINEIGATPYVPFKSNSTSRGKGSTWKRMYWYFKKNPQKWGRHYHKRSNVETTFHMIKQKFGSSLMTKNYEANANEILIKALCHNICVLIQEYFERDIELDLSTQTQKIEILVN